MPEFIMNYTGINKNIQEVSKVFAQQVDDISQTVFQLSKYYEVLGAVYQELDIKNMFQIHKFMSDVLTWWGNTYVDQGKIMRENFAKFFNYHTHEGDPLRELIKKRFSIKESYVKAEIKLSDKKEKLFKAQDFKKWELNKDDLDKLSILKQNVEIAKQYMLPKETSQVEEKRHLLNYYSNQVKGQVIDMWNNNYTDLWEHLMQIAWEHKEVASKITNNWNNLIDHFKGIDLDQYDDVAEIKQEVMQREPAKIEEGKGSDPPPKQVANNHASDGDNDSDEKSPTTKTEPKYDEDDEKHEDKQNEHEDEKKDQDEEDDKAYDVFDNPFGS